MNSSAIQHLRKTTYRLYPTPKQALALTELLRSHQQLYNAALEERISAWTKAKISISYEDQCKSLTVVRNDLPEWANIANSPQKGRRQTLASQGKDLTPSLELVAPHIGPIG